jgi:phosphoribosylglycinamide formyltransferase-1
VDAKSLHPGEMTYDLTQQRLVIGCAKGTALAVAEVQKSGGKWLSAAQFWNGQKLREGLRCEYRRKPGIVVVVSGTGRSLERLLRRKDAKYRVVGVLSSRADARANRIAEEHQIPCKVLADWSAANVRTALREFKSSISLICLAGFLKSFPILAEFDQRVINVHPALLPRFGGQGMYGMNVHKAVVAAGEKQSGASVHFVHRDYDDGPIISQIRVPIAPDDDPSSLADKVFAAESELLPRTIEDLLSGDLPDPAIREYGV